MHMKICGQVLLFRIGESRIMNNGLKKKLNKEHLVIEYSEWRILRVLLKNNEYICARLLNYKMNIEHSLNNEQFGENGMNNE